MPRKKLDFQIETILADISKLAEFTSEQVERAMDAISTLDEELARDVIEKDKIANCLYHEIKERCVQTIALQQPVAKDLRIISISMDVASNLERVGDYSVDIAKNVGYILEKPPEKSGRFVEHIWSKLKPLDREEHMIVDMSKTAVYMVRRAGQIFINEDARGVAEIMDLEEKIDRLYGQIFRELEEISVKNCAELPFALNLILTARYIERIADHAVNIANRTLYAAKGGEEFI